MSATATGTFTVQMTPQGEPHVSDGVSLGRMALNKRFEGDLSGTGTGTMLTAMTPVRGSAGYVAIERFDGTLAGRQGSFVFQHAGTMAAGTQSLTITVVPDSGSGALMGIAGAFTIDIADGVHRYRFDYALPTATELSQPPGSPEPPKSPGSPGSPGSPDSPDSPDSPGSPERPERPEPPEPEPQ